MSLLSDRPVFLIGYRGTGKSAVAPELAARLGFDWIDADDEIERIAGKNIAAIFAEDGEPAFRDLESRIVIDLASRRRIVIALGGGAVLRDDNRRAICSAGPVIWLTASVGTIQQRLAADTSTAHRRPNLTTAGGQDEVVTVMKARTPIYLACATLTVDTEGKSIASIVDEILKNL